MNDLTSRTLELQHAAHELMYLGMDGEPVYSDTFCRLNKEVLVKSDSLFSAQSSDVEEEANLCLALLMGYNATIYDDGDKEQKKQMVLNRICHVLEQLPASLLKVRLLTYTYGEVYEEVLFQEAYAIIEGWNKDNLTSEQTAIIEELKNIEENPYPFEVVECKP
ncbi:MAG: UpxZ family transcription anti-terminator antagonist [Bacteroides uniformis]|nr:UpxZ family transcription anti-terminator antagonist [Bacteroides uniformis]